jgi:hypothetical protein
MNAPAFKYLAIGQRDLTLKLPPEAKKRYSEIADRVDDLRAVIRSISDKRDEAHQLYSDAEQRFRSLTDPMTAMRFSNEVVAEDHPSAIDAAGKMKRHRAEVDRLRELYEQRNAEADPLRAALGRIDSYLAYLGADDELKPYKASTPATKGKSNISAELEKLRDAIARGRADLHRVRSAPLPSAKAKAQATAAIEMLAARGTVDVMGLISHGDPIRWPEVTLRADIHAAADTAVSAIGFTQSTDALGMLAWVFRDQLINAINKEIDLLANDDEALTDEQRRAREQKLAAEILDLEQKECRLIEQLGDLSFRPDADPRAILGIDARAPRGDL